jgi:hypothetical protein
MNLDGGDMELILLDPEDPVPATIHDPDPFLRLQVTQPMALPGEHAPVSGNRLLPLPPRDG